ncbi:MAG: ABC transporter ATP-binding protein [Chloroflexi bacterium]|nr:ABC transporter ATP-binding protein [Chloroflexota bacterium]
MNDHARDHVVQVDGLRVEDRAGRAILRDVSVSLPPGSRLGIVGESGAGKTTLALGLLGHFRPGLTRTAGAIHVAGHDVLAASARQLRAYRRSVVSYLGQDPAAALTPNMRIGAQVAELLHGDRGDDALRARFEAVGLPGDRTFRRRYPHQVSGGQLQRVAIARALAPDPAVLVLDEPTAALDLLTRGLIAEEIERQADLRSLALVMVSHDLAMVARSADELVVLREGVLVESGSVGAMLTRPTHAYTRELVEACDGEASRLANDRGPAGDAVLRVRGLAAGYRQGREPIPVVEDFDLDVAPGECVALIGASGAGKSTIAHCLLGLHPPASGEVTVAGERLAPGVRQRSVAERRTIQLVPQDPLGSLNPRRRVGDTLRHALRTMRGLSRREADAEAARLLERVRLSPELLRRLPRELSGGERQRVAIARALAAEPHVLICDEVTSALDVSVEASILDLIDDLRADSGMAVLLIAHDLRVVRRIADRAVVLHDGRVREHGPVEDVLGAPRHELTRALVAADRPVGEIVRGREQRGWSSMRAPETAPL